MRIRSAIDFHICVSWERKEEWDKYRLEPSRVELGKHINNSKLRGFESGTQTGHHFRDSAHPVTLLHPLYFQFLKKNMDQIEKDNLSSKFVTGEHSLTPLVKSHNAIYIEHIANLRILRIILLVQYIEQWNWYDEGCCNTDVSTSAFANQVYISSWPLPPNHPTDQPLSPPWKRFFKFGIN